MRNYDYLEDMMAKVDSQATLLQLYGYHSESLQVYNKKIDSIRRTNDSEESVGKCIIRKADALRISGDYEAAEKEYQTLFSASEKMKLISYIHLAELYLQRGEDSKFNDAVGKFASKVDCLKSTDKEEYFKAYNFMAIRTINTGDGKQIKEAESMLNRLQSEIVGCYPYSIEGKSVVHDIYRTKATCQLKQNKHREALDLLKTTLELQMACEGKTANVALTETLIQTACRTSKNSSSPEFESELKASMGRMSSLSEEI